MWLRDKGVATRSCRIRLAVRREYLQSLITDPKTIGHTDKSKTDARHVRRSCRAKITWVPIKCDCVYPGATGLSNFAIPSIEALVCPMPRCGAPLCLNVADVEIGDRTSP